MRIRRSRLTANFVQVPNDTARNDSLSHMARGILVEILSRPDGWETTADDMWRASLARHGKASPGRRAFRAAFAELKDHRYLVAERTTLDAGRFATVLTAYDIPAAHADVPHAGTPESGEETAPGVSAGETDVPHGGTPDASDVPHGGTPGRPGETGVSAGGTDVPPTDVPHGGTSNYENGPTKTDLKTGGDGRRPTTGSGGAHDGGSAAAAQASPDEEKEEEEEELRAAAVGCVLGLMPSRLRDQLPNPVPKAVVDAIRKELVRGLTADQLVERVGRRWQNHGYENDAESADGPGILRPVGVAIALVRRGQCTSERCDDGTDVDTGARCRTCEREAEDRKRRREAAQAPVQGTILVGVPSGATDAAPAAPRPARRLPAQRTEIRDCERACGSVHRTVPAPAPAGLCPRCTADDEAQAVNG